MVVVEQRNSKILSRLTKQKAFYVEVVVVVAQQYSDSKREGCTQTKCGFEFSHLTCNVSKIRQCVETECFYSRIPLVTLLYAGYTVNLKNTIISCKTNILIFFHYYK